MGPAENSAIDARKLQGWNHVMGDQYLRDNAGKHIATIQEQGSKQNLYTATGKYLGCYDASTGYTYDAAGRSVGSGNQLGTLIR